jgi:hypothetical protein
VIGGRYVQIINVASTDLDAVVLVAKANIPKFAMLPAMCRICSGRYITVTEGPELKTSFGIGDMEVNKGFI